MLAWVDRIPWLVVGAAVLTLGLAPFFPQPHIWEKLLMLAAGRLRKSMDIFDLLFHAAPWLILILKIIRSILSGPDS